jgi:hypothetical protein
VIQELELLIEKLRSRPKNANVAPVLRRLSRTEFKDLRETGHAPYPGVVAILVVPPVNRDPATKTRPASNVTALPDTALEPPTLHKRNSPPLSVLYSAGTLPNLEDLPPSVQDGKIPLYNGMTLFPSLNQRAALHDKLSNVLDIERHSRNRDPALKFTGNLSAKPAETKDKDAPRPKSDDQKASHAFVLFSSRDTVLRIDTAPLAVAIWRLRMWEGSSFTSNHRTWSSVELNVPVDT